MIRTYHSSGSHPPDRALRPAPPQREVIDLTTSPSPPPSSRPRPYERLPDPYARRHTPYEQRNRGIRRDRDRRPRSPPRRPGPDAEVIDLDDYPDPEPVRRYDSRERHYMFPPASPGDIELTFAHARVRQPSQHPFPENNSHQSPRAGSVGGAPEEPPLDNMLFAPFGFRPNVGSVGGHFGSILDIVNNFGLPTFTGRFGFFNNAGEPRGHLAPHLPHRDPPDVPSFPFRNGFRAPGADLDWTGIPRFAQQDEEDLEITGQHNQKDKPIKAARDGFTRSPKSEDALGCSNCDQELGDSDDEIRKQIWIMKCGHCYCGECANNMLSQPIPKPVKGRKGKYATCAIDGCRTTLSGKKFIWEIYV
ncbi:hypothetical protein H072_1468 [Dactylellina haptotyla CBS 200.50]|uniref:RING-type domain-containing protein n=1 Tax=Dactylellina haptotyla (strain CBS 200.50) TaxID=1284197 RepID=S8ANL5_DACHA|nr:hypothetical protein H072_1468 [Dactylellina haptotyla CBS 200.50]